MNRIAIAVLAAASLTSAAIPAFAAGVPAKTPAAEAAKVASGTPAVRVTLTDLDLSTAAGVAAARKRVVAAATRYCTFTKAGAGVSQVDSKCKAVVVAKSMAQLDVVLAGITPAEARDAEPVL